MCFIGVTIDYSILCDGQKLPIKICGEKLALSLILFFSPDDENSNCSRRVGQYGRLYKPCSIHLSVNCVRNIDFIHPTITLIQVSGGMQICKSMSIGIYLEDCDSKFA